MARALERYIGNTVSPTGATEKSEERDRERYILNESFLCNKNRAWDAKKKGFIRMSRIVVDGC